jgi:hypothetical protein
MKLLCCYLLNLFIKDSLHICIVESALECEVETVRPDGWRSAFVVGGENWRRCLVVAGCGGGVGGGRGIWVRGRSTWEREEKIKRIRCFHFR